MLQKKSFEQPYATGFKVSAALLLFVAGAFYFQSCVRRADTTTGNVRPKLQEKALASPIYALPGNERVYEYVSQMPEPIVDINTFLGHNLHYPADAQKRQVEGKVFVRFIVDKDGNIVHPVVMRSVDSSLSNEAIRVVSMMPKWKPGIQNGVSVAVAFTIPVDFRLN